MKFLRRACAGWLLLAALCAGSAETNFGPNLFSFDRMGAGVPAGWRLTGRNYEWTAEPQLGPLGAGAARIRFAGKGSVSLESPATAMRPEVRHLLRVWVRSEPGGATVRIRLRDNGFFPTGSVGVPLSGGCVATGQWQPMTLGTTATLINESGKWKLKTLGVGPQLPLVTP